MIPPDRINPAAAEQLIYYLRNEISNSLADRAPLEERWMNWHRMYRAQPEFDVKEFPFYGAANLVIPVIATSVDTTFSRLMGLLFSPSNLWSCRPIRPDMIEFSTRLEEFLEVVQEREIGAYNAVADFLLDLCKLGTGVLKQRFRRESKLVYEFRETPQGLVDQVRRMMTANHAELRHVSLFDFLMPPTATTVQSSPWAAERVSLTWQQYANRVREGIYTGANRIGPWMALSKGSPINEEMMRLERYQAGQGDKLEFWETWLDYDIGGVGEPQAIVATIHIPTLTFARIDYNPFFNQEKPYSAARYMRQEGRFLGIGLAEMLEHFQDEITAMHNQRIDSGTLANTTMFKGRNGAVSQDEPIYPGRWFILDDMDDVQALTLGSPGKLDSSINYEQATLQYAKERSGINDYVMGNAQPSIGYAALGTNLQQLEQVTQRFDQVLREVRAALGESGTRIVELYQQFNYAGREYLYLGEEDGTILNQFLQFPLELARMGVGIEVTATSAALNKDVEIRTNTLLMQLLSQFYGQMLGTMQIALNPQIPEPMRNIAMLMMQGGSTMMRRILDGYGVQDASELVPRFQELMNGQQAGLGGIAGYGADPGGFAAQPGMGGPAIGAPAIGGLLPPGAGF